MIFILSDVCSAILFGIDSDKKNVRARRGPESWQDFVWLKAACELVKRRLASKLTRRRDMDLGSLTHTS